MVEKILVRVKGFEPPRSDLHRHLKPARLPVPPHPQVRLKKAKRIIPHGMRERKHFFAYVQERKPQRGYERGRERG